MDRTVSYPREKTSTELDNGGRRIVLFSQLVQHYITLDSCVSEVVFWYVICMGGNGSHIGVIILRSFIPSFTNGLVLIPDLFDGKPYVWPEQADALPILISPRKQVQKQCSVV